MWFSPCHLHVIPGNGRRGHFLQGTWTAQRTGHRGVWCPPCFLSLCPGPAHILAPHRFWGWRGPGIGPASPQPCHASSLVLARSHIPTLDLECCASVSPSLKQRSSRSGCESLGRCLDQPMEGPWYRHFFIGGQAQCLVCPGSWGTGNPSGGSGSKKVERKRRKVRCGQVKGPTKGQD